MTEPAPSEDRFSLPQEFYMWYGRIAAEFAFVEKLAATVVVTLIHEDRDVGHRVLRPLPLNGVLRVGFSLAETMEPGGREWVENLLRETDRLRKARNDLLHSVFAPTTQGAGLRQSIRDGHRITMGPSKYDLAALSRLAEEVSLLLLHLIDYTYDEPLFIWGD